MRRNEEQHMAPFSRQSVSSAESTVGDAPGRDTAERASDAEPDCRSADLDTSGTEGGAA